MFAEHRSTSLVTLIVSYNCHGGEKMTYKQKNPFAFFLHVTSLVLLHYILASSTE